LRAAIVGDSIRANDGGVDMLKILVAMSILVAAPAVAQTRTVDGTDPANIVSAFQAAGYKALLDKRDNGDPYISSAANGSNFSVEFYGCENGRNCSSLQFYAWYKKKPFYTEALANDWNRQKRFLKAYIDKDGDLATTLDVTTTGALGAENFADTLDWWSVMTAELFKFLAERE
jgi:hypothetical protein